LHNPVRGDEGVTEVEGLDGLHPDATAVTAVADEANLLPDIIGGLGQPGLLAFFQDAHCLVSGNLLGAAIPDKYIGGVVEAEAGQFWAVTGFLQEACRTVALADANGYG